MPFKDPARKREYNRQWIRKQRELYPERYRDRAQKDKPAKHNWYIANRGLTMQRAKTWKKDNPELLKKSRSREVNKVRLQVLQKISQADIPKCVYCGCDEFRFLEVNHKDGGGGLQIKQLRSMHINFYRAILNNFIPTDDLEVACKPCNALHYLKLKYGDVANRLKIAWE